jgi:hypothetical protein
MAARFTWLAGAAFVAAVSMWVGVPGHAAESGQITGVVTSASGPEEGVWVIAETDDFEARLVKTVVTGDGGRFLIPELPAASYQVWVRGYGLVDSAKTDAEPGQDLKLQARVAADEVEAAKVYPANWARWQRDLACHARAGPVGGQPEAGVHAVSSTRQSNHS